MTLREWIGSREVIVPSGTWPYWKTTTNKVGHREFIKAARVAAEAFGGKAERYRRVSELLDEWEQEDAVEAVTMKMNELFLIDSGGMEHYVEGESMIDAIKRWKCWMSIHFRDGDEREPDLVSRKVHMSHVILAEQGSGGGA